MYEDILKYDQFYTHEHEEFFNPLSNRKIFEDFHPAEDFQPAGTFPPWGRFSADVKIFNLQEYFHPGEDFSARISIRQKILKISTRCEDFQPAGTFPP